VTGLTKDDFELLDNGKRQEISVFSSDVQAIAVALLIDRSGSVSRDAGEDRRGRRSLRGRVAAGRSRVRQHAHDGVPAAHGATKPR
jgi:hypothetical protein